jgi:high-affinity iron transporter
MQMRTILNCCIAMIGLGFGRAALPQETPGKRLGAIVAVAVDEYKLGVDSLGRIISAAELAEARAFFNDAREVAGRVTGARAASVSALVDSLAHAIDDGVPSGAVDALYTRFLIALGPDGSVELPSRPADPAEGKRIFSANCASCHGANGLGDGPLATTIDPRPASLATVFARDVTPAAMHRVLSVGVKGTAMEAWADRLSSDQRWDVIAYIASLNITHGATPANATLADVCTECVTVRAPSAGHADVTTEVERRIGQALDAARAGRLSDAGDRAFDAYLAFEPIENNARARNAALVSRLEGAFVTLRGAVRAGDIRTAERGAQEIAVDLREAVALTERPATRAAVFGQSVLIIVREGFEAILIIGAIVALLLRTGNQRRVHDVWIGAGLAVVASGLTAVVLQTTLRALPATRELVEGVTMLVAVAVLFSVSYWILSKVESDRWQRYVRQMVEGAISRGGRAAMTGVAFLVVYREGAETVLFYQALLQSGAAAVTPIMLGIAVGSVALVGVYVAIHRFGTRVPLRPFFGVTGVLLYAMAFVFLGNGLRELQEGGALPVTALRGLPVIPSLGMYGTVETTAAQAILLGLFLLGMWWSVRRSRLTRARRSPPDQVPPSSDAASTPRPQRRSPAQTSAPS